MYSKIQICTAILKIFNISIEIIPSELIYFWFLKETVHIDLEHAALKLMVPISFMFVVLMKPLMALIPQMWW